VAKSVPIPSSARRARPSKETKFRRPAITEQEQRARLGLASGHRLIEDSMDLEPADLASRLPQVLQGSPSRRVPRRARTKKQTPFLRARFPPPLPKPAASPSPTASPSPAVDSKNRDSRRASKLAALRAARAKGKKLSGPNALTALAALGGVGAGSALVAGPIRSVTERMMGVDDETLQRKALSDLMASRAEAEQRQLVRQAQVNSIDQSIQGNLMRLQQSAPDIYAAVAAGRKLPQGAVVIGGSPRQDLLNELGRAMADGRFSR